jgi:predicted RecA/RadA family phage recombinase
MARNQVFENGDYLSLAATAPTTPASGDPVLVGQMPGVALTDEGDGGNAATHTSIHFSGVYDLSVKGENAAGNSAVAVGDILYYEAGQTPPLNKDATNGVRFGYALETVTSGATATIRVKVGY